jgi:phosphoglucosamine mutase
MRADLGIMISASHNPSTDNGIKFFGPDGFKLSDSAEVEIEALALGQVEPAQPENIGRARRVDEGRMRYVEYVKTTFPRQLRLSGLKIVVDCAHGAAYRAAPEILWELGAEVVAIGVDPNGRNINDGVGSTAPEAAARAVVENGADMGICLDGDADRVIVIDETGRVCDGDQIMGLLASRWSEQGRLVGNTLVATVMSNLGLERFLDGRGIALERAAVGDRYVVEAMRRGGWNLGGEQSGHIVMTDHATTGDGIMAALQVLAAMVQTGQPASDILSVFEPIPQVLRNVRYAPGADPLSATPVKAAIAAAEAALRGEGRLLIRVSGTEPLIRVMGEAEDEGMLARTLDGVVAAVTEAAG